MIRIVFVVSSSFSIIFFIMAIFQIFHIIWNWFNFDKDWQAIPKAKKSKTKVKKRGLIRSFIHEFKAEGLTNLGNRLNVWIWAGIVAMFIIVILMPLLHI